MAQTPPRYTVGTIPNLGRGWIAMQLILKGEVIFEEVPCLTAADTPSDDDVKSQVTNWSNQWQNWFQSLEIAQPFQGQGPYKGRFLTNSFPIGYTSSGQPLAGLFMSGAWFNHSCQPNVIQRWDSRKMSFRALRDIHPGEPLCIAYDQPGLVSPRRIRQERLWRSAGFTCQCPVCIHLNEVSDQKRAWLGQVIEAPFVTDTYEQEQQNLHTIQTALRYLQEEGLYHYRDTLYYDAFRVCQAYRNRNNAMLWPEAEGWLRLAYDAAVTIAGADNPRVREIGHMLETKEVPPDTQL